MDVQGQREVGVAFVARRPRKNQEDVKCWKLGFYQFLDNDQVRGLHRVRTSHDTLAAMPQFSHLDSVLLQLQCDSCYMHKGNKPSRTCACPPLLVCERCS